MKNMLTSLEKEKWHYSRKIIVINWIKFKIKKSTRLLKILRMNLNL